MIPFLPTIIQSFPIKKYEHLHFLGAFPSHHWRFHILLGRDRISQASGSLQGDMVSLGWLHFDVYFDGSLIYFNGYTAPKIATLLRLIYFFVVDLWYLCLFSEKTIWMVVLMVGMLSLCRICSVPVDNGPHYVLDGTANEIWPKKATSVGTGAFGPVISIHVSVCRFKSNLSWACWWTLCTPRRQLLQRHGQFSDFFGKYLLLNTAALKGNTCGLQIKN